MLVFNFSWQSFTTSINYILQNKQLSRICLSPRFSANHSINATINCSLFYVTMTSYKNAMFINKAGKHPIAIGPSIIQVTKELVINLCFGH